MNPFFLSILSNAVVAAVLATAVVLVSLRLRRPAILHFLWLVILVKLFMPPILDFGVLPSLREISVAVEAVGLVPVTGQVLATEAGLNWSAIALWSLIGIWIGGSLVVLAMTVIRMRRFRLLIARADPPDSELMQRVSELAAKIGCTRRPRIVVTDAQISPLVWSVFGRPEMVLPRTLFAKLEDGQRDTILAHELAHLKRGDDRVRWLELAALIVFWWNPTTWVASRFLRDAEEACCDALVAQTLPSQVEDYALGLVQTIRHLVAPEPSRLVAASGLGRPALIERRITSMFDKKIFRPMSLPARFFLILTAVLVLGLAPMLTARDAATPAGETAHAEEFSGDPINLHIKDADLGDVLATFSKLAGLDILTEPGLHILVSFETDNEPWDSVLDRMLKENGLTYSMDDGRIIVRRGVGYAAAAKKAAAVTSKRTFEGDPVFKYVTDGVITEPKKLGGPNPVYPEEARKAKEMGVVILECIIGSDGKVRNVDVLRSPRGDFSESAVTAVEQWLFEPALLKGEPVDVSYVLTVRFSLK